MLPVSIIISYTRASGSTVTWLEPELLESALFEPLVSPSKAPPEPQPTNNNTIATNVVSWVVCLRLFIFMAPNYSEIKTVISTRRFKARPSMVSLLAIGAISPFPSTRMRSLSTPLLSSFVAIY